MFVPITYFTNQIICVLYVNMVNSTQNVYDGLVSLRDFHGIHFKLGPLFLRSIFIIRAWNMLALF
uniref:Uncharacterized protein n=1 Tax=Arundo donax TaxID=35708 RepID=A0A0A9H9G7_ARUDO